MKKLTIVLFIYLFYTSAFSQFSIVEFNVFDFETKKPLKGAEISSKSFTKTYFTDRQGIARIAIGTDTILYQITAADYKPLPGKLFANADTILVVYLIPLHKSVIIEEVEILATAIHKQREETRIVPKEMRLLPGIGGTLDIGKLLVKQGGVHELNEGAGDILVRGGLPKHASYVMQNRIKFSTSAAKGLVSPFNAHTIQETVLNKSYIPPGYSDFLSGVVYLKPITPNTNRPEFKLNLNPFLASLFYSLPVAKEKSGLAVAARHTIFPYIAKLFNDLDIDIQNINYTDFSLISNSILNKQWSLLANFDLINDKESEIETRDEPGFYSYHENSKLNNSLDAELNLQYKTEQTEASFYTTFSKLETKYLFLKKSDNDTQSNQTTHSQQHISAGFSISQKIKYHTINYGSKLWQLQISPYKQVN